MPHRFLEFNTNIFLISEPATNSCLASSGVSHVCHHDNLHRFTSPLHFPLLTSPFCLSPSSALGARRTCWRGWSTPQTFMACAPWGPRRPPPWSRRFPPASLQSRLSCSPPAARSSSSARPRLVFASRSANVARGTRCTPSTRPSAWRLRRRRSAAAL